ncbi:hypothetical protein BD769DRAFT_1639885 [Suillus cothurnatus]|nr:hypothetical protein BD769DRAFT_1639885 [Suillus cothurnatus]
MSSESLDIYGLKPRTLSSVLDMSESSVSSERVETPIKLYDVKVVQFWRGEKESLKPYPLHWAIYVETSPGIGNTYQLVGNQTNYAIDIRLNQPLENSGDLRGSHSVGNVNWTELTEMETILSRVDIIHKLPSWNSQDWVDDALRYLKCWGFSGIVGETKLAALQEQMLWLLECWPGIENAVEFVGDSEDLACILSNRRSARVHRSFWKLHANTRALIEELTTWVSSRTERR